MNSKLSFFYLFAFLNVITFSCNEKADNSTHSQGSLKDAVVIPEPVYLFGIAIDSFDVEEHKIQRNQNLSEILVPRNVDYVTIDKLARKSKEIFDVRKIKSGNKYTLICGKDSLSSAKVMVYEKTPIEYVVFDLRDSVNIFEGRKKVDTVRQDFAGVIFNSLYMTIVENGGSIELAHELSEIYAWQIDFFRIQKNDKFKVVYEELFVEGESVGIHKILAAEFVHFGEAFTAYHFPQDNEHDYFDDEGQSLRKAFLKAPLKYSRISSKYSGRRFHPVQKRYKSHLGTDYAAPTGTPIYAVGDGIITEARYRKYNGNYVKIRHNSVYETQYLHMVKIKTGIRPGKKVKQGDVIGYVGSTGLATGPHCCFRFWKHGYQVDPFREKIPPSKPVAKDQLQAYNKKKKALKKLLKKVDYPDGDIIEMDTLQPKISMKQELVRSPYF